VTTSTLRDGPPPTAGRPTVLAAVIALLGVASLLGFASLLIAAPGAAAEDNGVSRLPAMGWSSWSFLRHDPTEAAVEAEASALVTSGLKSVGYRYINVDDYWYTCPGPQGPAVDRNGRWVIDAARFPSEGSTNGIQALADSVHHLGLKFGLYVTPGISMQAVAENTRIEGTDDTADEIATKTVERNYNCGGMVGIDYAKPGAQRFIDSWADEFARWGVDYVKLDGVGGSDISDVKAWSQALRQTRRPIQLELSNGLAIEDASTWQAYSNGWRTGADIDCYCSDTSYPLTDWFNVQSRFDEVADWAPYGGPGAFNDYDSIEVGNGSNDGLTPPERQTQLSLWALAAAPLILGADLTHLDPADRSDLLNRSVISVDQDAIDAHRILDTMGEQVFTKTEPSGDVVVGLFNTHAWPDVVSTDLSQLGLSGRREYLVDNLWSGQRAAAVGRISEEVPARGVALLRVEPSGRTRSLAPLTALGISGLTSVDGADTLTEKVMFTDDGARTVERPRLTLAVPSGWKVTGHTEPSSETVAPGQTISTQMRVAVPPATQPFTTGTLTAGAVFAYPGGLSRTSSPATVTVAGAPIMAPLSTYSSATDAPAAFSRVGPQVAIEGAGTNLYSRADDYSAIYEPRVVTTSSSVSVEVTSEQNLTGYAKAGIMIRNDIAGAETTPEGVILYDSPSAGVQLEYDDDGAAHIDAATPANGTIRSSVPIYLKLIRDGDAYTGFYSTDGTTWQPVGSATVPGQAATQDAGMFEVSHNPGVPGVARFENFDVG
jgi:hypothetical protein